jgi:hypothetical protein
MTQLNTITIYRTATITSFSTQYSSEPLKVHKNGNFFGSDFEFCTISLLVLLKYLDLKKNLIGPLMGEI